MDRILDWKHIEQPNYEPARLLPIGGAVGSHTHHVAAWAPFHPDANSDNGHVHVICDDYGRPHERGLPSIVNATDPHKRFLHADQFTPGQRVILTRGGLSMIFREIEPFAGSAFTGVDRFLICGEIERSRGGTYPGVWLETGKSITRLFPDYDIDTADLELSDVWLSNDEPPAEPDKPAVDTTGWVEDSTQFLLTDGTWVTFRRHERNAPIVGLAPHLYKGGPPASWGGLQVGFWDARTGKGNRVAPIRQPVETRP